VATVPRIRHQRDLVHNLQAAGWDLAVAAILVIVSASALVLAVLPR
jgi:hypothetical protein